MTTSVEDGAAFAHKHLESAGYYNAGTVPMKARVTKRAVAIPGVETATDMSNNVQRTGCGYEGDADPDLAQLTRLVDDLEETSAALLEQGVEHDVPAIEHNARRIRDVVRVLEQNVPREREED